MVFFKDNIDFVINRVNEIGNLPLKKGSHLFGDYGSIPIRVATFRCLEHEKNNEKKPAIIFLRVVLAVNRSYEKQVRHNIRNIEQEYPNLKTFKDLENLISAKSKDEFFKLWGHNDEKKYNILLELLKSVKILREKYKIENDYDLMNKWANELDLKFLKDDVFNKIKNIALATIQHLRIDFGVDTVKPDQRVIEVLQREFVLSNVSQKKAILMVEEISKITKIKTREIDLIFVNYGSGYFDNRKFNSIYSVRINIARNLLKTDLNCILIADVTGLTEDEVLRIKESN